VSWVVADLPLEGSACGPEVSVKGGLALATQFGLMLETDPYQVLLVDLGTIAIDRCFVFVSKPAHAVHPFVSYC
jgi:hypothetical protein